MMGQCLPMIANELMPFLACFCSSPLWENSAAEIAAAPVKVTDPETKVVSGTGMSLSLPLSLLSLSLGLGNGVVAPPFEGSDIQYSVWA